MPVTKAPEGLNEEAQYDYFIDLASKSDAPIEALQRRDDGTEHLLVYQPGAKQATQEIQIGEDVKIDDTGNLVLGALQQAALAERQAISASGEPLGVTGSFFDTSRGVNVPSLPGQSFQLFGSGGVRPIEGTSEIQKAPTIKSSLFEQPGEGVVQQQLGITPAEGKTIKRTGQTGKNPTTGVDVPVGPDEIFIEYEDGTFEVRKHDAINEPGQARSLSEAGPTAEELGITRQTSIQGGAGAEVTRAPFSAAEALAQAKTPEEMEKVITDEGGTPTSKLQFVGTTYRGKQAKEGYAFYVDPKSKEILQRPIELQGIAQPLTVTGVAGTKIDVVSKFKAVFGREPNAEELKYWMGRTDKIGGALIGAMQTAQKQGKGVGGTPKKINDPVEAMKAQANTGQETYAQTLTEAGITSKSSELRERKAILENIEVPDSEELTLEDLAGSQLQEAIADVNRVKDSLRRLDAGHLINVQEAEHGERARGLTTAQVRRNQTEFSLAYNRERAELTAELAAYNDILQSQQTMVELNMQIFQYNQQQAQVEYTNRFNKAMAMYNITAQEQEFEFNVQTQKENAMRANLSTIMGLVSEGVLDFDQLSPDQRAQIQNMEQAVGLGGLSQAIANTSIPPVVSMGSNITAADGTVYTPIISQDPRTGEVSISHYKHPYKERVPSSGGGTTALQKDLALAAQFGIDPVNVVEQNFGLPLTTKQSKPVEGPLRPGETRRNVDIRVPTQAPVDPSNYKSLGGGLYNVITGHYIPAPDDVPLF